jgi:hypothetical protein
VKGSWNYRHYSLREYNRTRGISRNNNILFILQLELKVRIGKDED